MVYIGIDVGGTGIKIGLVNEEGQLIHQGETPTLVGRPYQEIIADMGHCALKVLDEAKLTVDDVHSVGIGIPGIADAKTGNVIFCTNMGWKDVPLRSELQKYINKPVFIDNDATVAGFAESVAGVSKGTSSSVFLTLGTGVGGGIVINGRSVERLPRRGQRDRPHSHGHRWRALHLRQRRLPGSATAAPQPSSVWASRFCSSTPKA